MKANQQPHQTRFRSYSLNGELNYWIIADQTYGLPILQAFYKESQLMRPSRTYGFLDVTPETIDSGVLGMPGPAARTEKELRATCRNWRGKVGCTCPVIGIRKGRT